MEAAGHRTGIVLLSITWQEICVRLTLFPISLCKGGNRQLASNSHLFARTLSSSIPEKVPSASSFSSPSGGREHLPQVPIHRSNLPSPIALPPPTPPSGGSPLPCGCRFPANPQRTTSPIHQCESPLSHHLPPSDQQPPLPADLPFRAGVYSQRHPSRADRPSQRPLSRQQPRQQHPVNNTPLRVNRKEIPETDIMNWKFPIFGGSQQQQPQPNFQETPTQSWYPSSVSSSPSRTSTPTNSSGTGHQRTYDRPQSPSQGQPSPAEAAGIIAHLKDKSVDELRKLLTDKEAYNSFFNSLDQVKIQNNVRDELRKVTLQLARENLEKEPQILELRNQCTIIRTTELAAAQEKLAELERIKDETLSRCSPSALLEKLHDGMAEADKESEELHRQLLVKEIDLATFVQNYKKLRTLYHRRALLHLAAKTSGLAA